MSQERLKSLAIFSTENDIWEELGTKQLSIFLSALKQKRFKFVVKFSYNLNKNCILLKASFILET